jgi:hypothetical protein
MALYISAGRRRRRLVVVGAVCLVGGLLLGGVIGRASVPTAADKAASAVQSAERVDGQLRSLRCHYRLDPTGFRPSVDAAVPLAQNELEAAIASAAWLDAAAADDLRREVAEVRAVAARGASADEFDAAIDKAMADIDARFGRTANRRTVTTAGCS